MIEKDQLAHDLGMKPRARTDQQGYRGAIVGPTDAQALRRRPRPKSRARRRRRDMGNPENDGGQ
jgi:hypothetical protein